MAKIPFKIKTRIKKYLTELINNNIPIQKAYLFGSYAKGTFHEHSDIDIALISESFRGNRFEDKCLIRKITLANGSDIEPLPYTPEDFTAEDPFVKHILETGVEVQV